MSVSRNIPYSDIIGQFRTACSASLSVATFETGTIDFLDSSAVNKDYPYIFLRPISSPGVVDKVKTNTFELYSLDIPLLSDQSPEEIISECEARIYETIAWFNQGPANRQQTYEITMTDLTPVNEAFQDRAFGWVATIEVITPFVWDYCDYPQIIAGVTPTPTATIRPTATPIPDPTPTPTTSPTPTASPTATPIVPTATPTPTGTPVPTATATPLPTPPPSPTPSPTAAPTYFGPWYINHTNHTSSIDVCDNSSSGDFPVYSPWNDETQVWPDRIIGKPVYTDSSLTNLYVSNSVEDGRRYRIADYQNEPSQILLEWTIFTGSNEVLEAAPCDYPQIDTLPSSGSGFNTTVMRGQVDDFAGRTFDLYGFEYGTTTSSLDTFLTASFPSTAAFSASLNVPINDLLYYRAKVRDTETGFFYYGDIEEARPATAYPWKIYYEGNINSLFIDGTEQGAVSAAENLIAGGWCYTGTVSESEFLYVPMPAPKPTGSFAIGVESFIGLPCFFNEEMTNTARNDDPDYWYGRSSNFGSEEDYGNSILVTKDLDIPWTPLESDVISYIATGSISCIPLTPPS